MSEKTLAIILLSLLAIGIVSVLAIAIPWTAHYGEGGWKKMFFDDGLIIVAIGLFLYGAYVNTRIH